MAKLKLGVNKQDQATMEKLAAENTFKSYTGEPPKPGVYEGVVKTIWYTEAEKSGKPMFRVAFEIREPDDSKKAEFNGWFRMTYLMLPIDKEDKNYGRNCGDLKQFLEAISQGSSAWKGYLNDDITIDETKPDPKVTAIGTYKHNAKTGAPVVVVIRQEGEYNGEPDLRIRQWNLPRDHQLTGGAAAEPAKKKLVVDDEPDEDTGAEYEEETQEEEKPAPRKRAASRRRKPEPEPEPEAEDDEDVDPTDFDEDEEPEKVQAAKAKRASRRKPEPEPEEPEDDDETDVAYVPDDEEDEYEPEDTAEEAAAEEDEEEAEEESPAEPEEEEEEEAPAPRRRRRKATFADD